MALDKKLKTCTVVEIKNDRMVRFVDFSIVDDNHKFGLYPHTNHLHIEGSIEVKYVD